MRKIALFLVAVFAGCSAIPRPTEVDIKLAQLAPHRMVYAATSSCTPPTDFTPAVCGNGVVNYGEACDDGNIVDGDGCSALCLSEAPVDNIFDSSCPLHSELQQANSPAGFSDKNEHGAFRMAVDFNHPLNDDPIVSPCQPGAAHLHTFLGNTSTNNTTVDVPQLLAAASSTSLGNRLNKSAYWVPTPIYPSVDASGNPTYSAVWPLNNYVTDDHDVPVLNAQGRLTYTNLGAFIYYKRGSLPANVTLKPLPEGLRIVAGNHNATSAQAQEIARWSCVQPAYPAPPVANVPGGFSGAIPKCPIGSYVRAEVFFPQCWSGLALDTSDHKSHMTYPVAVKQPNGTYILQCPAAYPQVLPQLSYHLQYIVTRANADASGTSASWFLSSDMYVADATHPGGFSLHADYMMAWDRQAMSTWVQKCLNEQRSCSNGDMGNGFRLATQLAGAGDTQPYIQVINRGLGDGVTSHP